jgi:hypothetical protein
VGRGYGAPWKRSEVASAPHRSLGAPLAPPRLTVSHKCQCAPALAGTSILWLNRFVPDRVSAPFVASVDQVFRGEGISVILTPPRAPQANAYAERFVRTVRAECLDWLLILGPRQLDLVLRVFVEHYNRSARTGHSVDVRQPRPSRYGRRPRVRRSNEGTDSEASCTSTTAPRRYGTGLWHHSGSPRGMSEEPFCVDLVVATLDAIRRLPAYVLSGAPSACVAPLAVFAPDDGHLATEAEPVD